MDPSIRLFFYFISTRDFPLHLNPNCLQVMSMIVYAFPEKQLAPWQDALSPRKLALSSLNQLSIDVMRKWPRISMYTCALIVEVMIAISPGPITPYYLTREFYSFFFQSSLYVSFERYLTEVPAADCPMPILDLSLNITFVQFSTHYHCFYIAHFNLIFFCRCVTIDFR